MTDLITLSKMLGVSPGTISRVLNNHPSQRISNERRQYILEGARKYDYRPNSAARSLAVRKTLNVALVMHQKSSALNIVNPSPNMDIMMALEQTLQENHYGLNLVFISRDKPEVSFSRLVRDYRSFDALVFPTGVATKGMIDFALEYQIPTAVIGDKQAREWPVNYFHVDEMADVRQAVSHLMELGHRRIAVVGWDEAGRMKENTFTRQGFEVLAEQGIPVPDEWIIAVEETRDAFLSYRDHGRAVMKRLLAGAERPTAIITSRDMIGMGLLDVMTEQGVVPGRDLSIVGHGNLEERGSCPGHHAVLTTFDLPFTTIGNAAALTLLAQINDKKMVCRHELYPSRLIVRSSTRS